MNLARLVRAGLPVPDGFLITTNAYRRYAAANQLALFIQQTVAAIQPDNPAALNEASQAIRARFSAGKMPQELATAVTTAYREINKQSSAPRSPAPLLPIPPSPSAPRPLPKICPTCPLPDSRIPFCM